MPTPVDVQNFDGVTAPTSTVTGWVIPTGHSVVNTGASARSSPNVLQSTTAGNLTVYETTADTNTGKTSWAFSVRVAGTQAGASTQYIIPAFRVIANPATWNTITCYALYFTPGNTTTACQIYLVRRLAGGDTNLGTVLNVNYDATNGILFNTWYDILITADDPDSTNTVINVQLQRPNGDYMTGGGNWSATQQNVLSRTSNVTALKANSTVGALLFIQGGATGLQIDNSDYESLAGGGTAWTKTLTEILSYNDTRTAGAAHSLSESLLLTDTRFSSASRNLTESLLFSDTRIMSVAKSLAETLVLSDLRTASVGKTAQETLAFLDALTRAASYQRTLSETLVLSDVRAAGLARKLSETYGLSDSVAAGIVTAATLIIVSIGPGGSA